MAAVFIGMIVGAGAGVGVATALVRLRPAQLGPAPGDRRGLSPARSPRTGRPAPRGGPFVVRGGEVLAVGAQVGLHEHRVGPLAVLVAHRRASARPR